MQGGTEIIVVVLLRFSEVIAAVLTSYGVWRIAAALHRIADELKKRS